MVSEPHCRSRSLARSSGPPLQRPASHDGEGFNHLVQGNRNRPESGGPSRGKAAGRPTGPYLSADELRNLKHALDGKTYRKGTKTLNRTFYRLRLLVLIALTTGMRIAEIFGLRWPDVMYGEGLIAVRAKLKG